MSSLKSITLYSHPTGPNPWKVAIIMEELDIPYESEMIDFSVIKKVSPAKERDRRYVLFAATDIFRSLGILYV